MTHFVLRRPRAAASFFPTRKSSRAAAAFALALLICGPARAVVVRGHVTDALGSPLSGARVQLIEDGKSVAFAYAGADGSYEIRYANGGRFTLLGSGAPYLPYISPDFYGGATDVLDQDVVLALNSVRQDISVSATGIPTPLPQLTAPVTVIPGDLFADQLGVSNLLRQSPGAFVVQTGQTGGVTSLFLRGGNSTANLVLVDGIPADDIGGIYDYGTVGSTAVGRMEIYRGPNSAMYGTDAGAGVVTIDTPRGTTVTPQLTYSGDAGSLHEWRNEVTAGGTWKQLDYFGAFGRLDTSNALPNDRFHSVTSAANLGYDLNGNTTVRFTIRNADSRTGVPGAWDFQGLSTAGSQADQDLYSGITVDNRFHDKWHNLVRYGIARKREQENEGDPVGNYVASDPGEYYGPGYVGNLVTIRGANGYTATGQVQLFSGNNYDQASNRDQLYYQSDYTASRHFIALFGFRYDNERGVFNDFFPAYSYSEHEIVKRTNFEYNLQFQGEFFNRLFYSAGGAVEKNHLYGIAGTPRLGLAYVPVRPSTRPFRGTRLRANAATGVQEPTLALEFSSLYQQLLSLGDTADIAAYHIGPQAAERSRTYDLGVDQNIFGEKLMLKAGYFHNVFDHQLEGISASALTQYFNYPFAQTTLYSAYLNSLAYRAQGAEAELVWQPVPSLLVRGGYTFLAGRVLQSFASDAVAANQGVPSVNPLYPTIAIGAESPLVGARPFRRAPNTGYFDVQYTHKHLGLQLLGALASRSDDSTFLDGEDYNGTNTLILPNRDLDFGYAKLDLGGTYAWKHGVTVFAQVNNLLNDQHIGPIGFPGLPLTARAGLKLRIGGNK